MKKNATKERLLKGEPALGIVLGLGSPFGAGLLAGAGFDFVLVDNQHGNWDDDLSLDAFRSINLGTATPMTRVRWNDFSAIGRLLDRGALGLAIPMVNSAAEAHAAAFSARFPPQGGRSQGFGMVDIYGSDYDKWINDQLLLMVQIETVEAVAASADIFAVAGIDGCWIGPGDLSRSLGVDLATPGGAKAHEAAILRVLDACRQSGKIPGIHAQNAADARRWLGHGFLYVTVGTDVTLLMTAARDSLRETRK